MSAHIRFLSYVSTLALLVVSSIGCQTVSPTGSTKFDAAVAQQEVGAAQAIPSYIVEVRPSGGKRELVKYPLEGNITVYDAIDEVNGFKRFRRRITRVIRKNSETGARVKLQVREDKHGITPGTDYAIHPNDRIIIEEDPTSPVGELLGAVSGPIDRMMGR